MDIFIFKLENPHCAAAALLKIVVMLCYIMIAKISYKLNHEKLLVCDGMHARCYSCGYNMWMGATHRSLVILLLTMINGKLHHDNTEQRLGDLTINRMCTEC